MAAAPTDEKLYKMFERVLREARQASDYEVEVERERADKSTYLSTDHVTERETLPWGQVDKIFRATWKTSESHVRGQEPWSVTISYHGFFLGLTVLVQTNLLEPFGLAYSVIGIKEQMRVTRPHDHLALESEDEVVARVVADIEDFFKVWVDYNNPANDEGEGGWGFKEDYDCY